MEYIVKQKEELFEFYTINVMKDINDNEVQILSLSDAKSIQDLENDKSYLENQLLDINKKLELIYNYEK